MKRQTPILDVPNEILLKIFDNLMVTEARAYRLAWPLALTCKRFYVLAQAIIWSHVSFESNDHEPEIETSWPTVGFCKRLRSRKTRKCLEIAPAAAISYVKHVSLHGAGETEIGFRDAIELMRRYPNLRRLDLDGVSSVSRIWDDSPARGQRFIKEPAEVVAPPPGLEGTSNLEELHLSRFKSGTPDALRSFLKWPANLRVFSIDELAHRDQDWDYLLQSDTTLSPFQIPSRLLWNP
ncbi:methylglyoxal reductase (NADPH-dependent) gre2 [Pestalotiopsis sp. IQ-011]